MKMLEYETANPGQDFDELEKQRFDPEKHSTRPPPVVAIQSTSTLAQDKDATDIYDAAPGAGIGHIKYATAG